MKQNPKNKQINKDKKIYMFLLSNRHDEKEKNIEIKL